MKNLLLSLLFLSNVSVFGQSFEQYFPQVREGQNTLYNIGAGAMIAPQFSQIDINNDGKLDLFVFDRSGDQVSLFEFKGTSEYFKYEYTSDYNSLFPSMNHFALLRDYNNDGLMDIFTLSNDISGIVVWKNIGSQATPKFEKIAFEDYDYGVLNYPLVTGSKTNIYVSEVDIPAIYDVDNDGDLDILTFEQGGATLEFYQNMSIERNLDPDAFEFEQRDACYGLFMESEFTEEIILSKEENVCAKGFRRNEPNIRHSGSTTMVFDPDGDGINDLLIGDLASSNLVFLKNGGSNSSAWITEQEINFPSSAPVDIDIFVGVYEIDVDNNGHKDLIMAPNNAGAADDINNVWYYKNTSTTGVARYELESNAFLQDKRLALGKYTYPVLVDYNNDGLKDILVGSSGYTQNGKANGRLFLFEQKSTHEFKLVDDDYLGMSSLTDQNLKLAPTIGDLDNDGDDDLLVANSIGYFFYFENIAGQDEPYDFSQYKYKYADIRPGLAPKPQLFDIDNDGYDDLITGEKNDNQSPDGSYFGGVNLYKNNSGSFDNDLDATGNTAVLGGIYTRDVGETSTGESAPFFIKTNDGLRCVVGSSIGKFRFYQNIDNNIYGVYDKLSDALPINDFGKGVSATLGQLDNDSYYEMVIGTASGGLFFYDTDIKYDGLVVSSNDVEFDNALIYPNPTNGIINVSTDRYKKIEVYSLDGRLILGSKEKEIDVSSLKNGMYLTKIYADNKMFINRLIKF